jgi:hypothetical protein
MNLKRSLLPAEAVQALEAYGQIAPEVPYGSQYFQENLPLPPQGPAQQMAGAVGSVVPLSPAEILQSARLARQAALAGGKFGKQGLGILGEEVNATLLGERPKSFFGAITPKPMYAVEPNANLLAQSVMKPKAEVSPLGFYSAVEQQALNIPRKQGTGASFLNDLSKGQDVKKYEIEAMGLEDFLKGKTNVTRQEVQDFIANNKIDIQERVLSGKGDKSGVFSEFNPDKNQFIVYGNDLSLHGAFNTAQEADKFVNNYNAQIPYGPSKYDKFQLPGGENYREVLLTLPDKKNQFPNFEQWITNRYGGEQVPENVRQAARKEYERQSAGLGISSGYQSSHFNEPNILAHMRVNDRVDAEGKKMLLIEEVQSDWHQAGREKGYNDPKAQAQAQEKIIELKEEHRVLGQLKELTTNEAERNAISQKRFDLMNQAQELSKVGQSGVPDAPFKDTWYQLALKRLTKYAADNGYERIGLTTGKQQAGRYALSNEVDEINVIGRTNMATGEKSKSVALDMKSGQSLRIGVNNDGIVDNVSDESIKNFMGKNLSEVVGKDIAKEIMLNNKKTISGEGLDIGGEGMKKYYDEIYPKFLDKYGKKYGASVGETKVNTVMERADNSMIPQMGQEPVRYLDITPQMKEGTSKGQPLFAATPLLPATSLLDEEKRKEITSLLE